MKIFLLGFACCALLLAQSSNLAVTVPGSTATQAIISYTAPDSAACTVQVSESSTLASLVADVDPALFAGSATDTAHAITPAGTARLIRVGTRTSAAALDGRWHSKALAADTKHYVRISCGSATGTAEFTTGVPMGFAPEPLPTDPAGWGNLAYPEFDFNDLSTPVIDPQTGIRIYAEDPKYWSVNSTLPITANWYGGGQGWTNPANVVSYGTATASTAGTNPLLVFLDTKQYSDGFRVSGGNWPYDNFLDLGVDLYGSGSDGQSTANRTVRLALSLDSGQTPYTNWVDAVLPSANGNAGTFPAQYPKAYFAGWGKILPRIAWPKRGSVTVAGGVVTLTKNDGGGVVGSSAFDANSYFTREWAVGTKIWISGSAPTCANNFCTIAGVTSSVRLTLNESITLGESEYRSAALTVMIQKATLSGTVNVSTRVRLAKGYPHDIWTGGCAPKAVTSGDGISGFPCIFPKVRQDAGGLYFVGTSRPVIRLVSLFPNPGTIPGHGAADLPLGAVQLLGPSVPTFDPDDGSTMYSALATAGGSIGLFKIRYTGDWRALDVAYRSASVIPPLTTELTWTNMTRSAAGRDMRAQILANTTYDEALWGSLSTLQGAGITGKYAAFVQTIGGQESACWIFAFDSSTGNFFRGWRTDDGTSLPALKYAGCHAVLPLDGNAVLLSTNGLRSSTTRFAFGGPFSAPVSAVLRGGTFSANTALPWPPAVPPAANGYDFTYPSDLAPQWIANGAKDNQCVTIQTSEPCSSFSTAPERAAAPCPWDPARSMVAPLAEGDFLKPGLDWDAEGFLVVRKTSLGGGRVQLILQRNANYSYCALGKDGIGGAFQYVHANGWTLSAVPAQACLGAGIVVDIPGNAAYVANQNLLRGHFDVTAATPGTQTWIGAGSFVNSKPVYLVQYNRSLPSIGLASDYAIPSQAPFAGYNSVHDVQSYLEAKQVSATAELRRYAFDLGHYNGPTGVDLEAANQVIGSPVNATLQAGTTAVYKLSFTGTMDPKRGIMNVWAGDKVLSEKSGPTQGNSLTDADQWRFCYAYRSGECRVGATTGSLFAVIPGADIKANCWASQLNLRVPCAMAGPVQAMRAVQVRVDAPDPGAVGQRSLGSLLMGPNQQYVYSKVLPTPDASYLLFAGFLLNGYHTGLLSAKLPPFVENSVAKSTFVPVTLTGRSRNSVYVEFGYEEFGAPGDFRCTARAESCRVSAALVNESFPYWFAHESFSTATGNFKISIPAISGRILYFRVVDGTTPGAINAIAVSNRLGK